VNATALLTAIIGAAYGAVVARDLMRGRRWMAASRVGIGAPSLLELVTLGHGSWLEHQVIFVICIALLIASLAAYGLDRREKQHDVSGFLQ
jgi:hypothetical protein